MKISIALCTYNGEQFIEEQLQSILQQTILPDEIIFCDDNSTDNTIAIAQKVLGNVGFKIKIIVNESNLGVCSNFQKAMSYCTGDLIVLCDQDDVWHPEKLSLMSHFFEQPANKKIQVLFADLCLVNETLVPTGETMWEYVGFNRKKQQKWESGKALDVLLADYNCVTGASIMLRRNFLTDEPIILQHKFERFIHDEVIAFAAAKTNSIAFLQNVLTDYRQHTKQVMGTRNNTKNQTFNWNQNIKNAADRASGQIKDLKLIGIPENLINTSVYHKTWKHYLKRQELRKKYIMSRALPLFWEVINLKYFRYSRSVFNAALKDFFASRIK